MAAEAILAKMSRVVRSEPSATIVGPRYVLASWTQCTEAAVDASRNLAWVGSVREIQTTLDLDNAACLEGDYALIVGEHDGLLLARGRYAGRCLYAARLHDGGVAACSRLEPLLGCLINPTTNSRTLASLIVRVPFAPSATVFSEVRRVEASQAMRWGLGIPARCATASFDLSPRAGSAEELAEELRMVLARIVRRSIEGKRRVAVLVSGGLDSSTVLAQAVASARGGSGPEIEAVTWSFAGPGDDRPHLRDLCDDLGIVPVRVSSSDAAPVVIRALAGDSAPIIWPTAAGIVAAQEKARDLGAETILTGLGGDQVFNVDPRIIAGRVWSGHFWDGLARARRLERHSPSRPSLRRLANGILAPRVVAAFPILRQVGRRRYARRRWPWAGSRLRAFLREVYVPDISDLRWMNSSSEERLQRLVSIDLFGLAETRGQMEAMTGLSSVDPLTDDEVVTLVAGFPPEVMLFGDRQRGILRHAMRQILPERLRLRLDKARFEPAIAEMVQGSDLRVLRELAKMRNLGELGLVDPPMYKRHFEEVLAAGGESADWQTIWPALAVEYFLRTRAET